MNEELIEINGTNYEMRKANFFEARDVAMTFLSVLNGAVSIKNGQPDINVGAMLSNLTSAEMEKVQSFILKYTVVNGVKLSSKVEAEKHFNDHRQDYFQLMFEGVKFHFVDFLPNGKEFAENMTMENLTKALA